MYNQAPVAAVNYTANNPGLKFTLIRGVFTSTGQLDYAPTDSTGIAKSLETTEFRKTRPSAGVVFEGYISVITDGIYNFSLANYADCQLFIDDIKLGENEGAISLLKGFHKIKIRHFYNAPPAGPRRRASPSPRVYIVAAGTTDRRVITPEMFFN